MSYFPQVILFNTSGSIGETNPLVIRHPDADEDSFSRLRVSEAVTLFDSQFQYDTQPLLWQTSGSLGGAATHRADWAAISMSVPATAGAYAIRQTYDYFRYQPGKAQSIIMTGVLGDSPTGVIKRLGYFDNRNGMFFMVSGSQTYVGLRSSVSTVQGVGTGVDTLIPQSSWNMDTMDGSGSSGMLLDITKAQIFMIDFQWLGTGRVRYGFDGHDGPIYVHEIKNANNNDHVYMVSPNLPLRYEILNEQSLNGSSMQQICSAVISEAGVEEGRGIDRSVSNGITTVTVTNTLIPVLSIRPRARIMTANVVTPNGNGYRNRAKVLHLSATMYVSTTDNIYYQVLYNATLTGDTWAKQVQSGSVSEAVVEADVAASAVTGGLVVAEGVLMQSTGRAQVLNLNTRLPFGLDLGGINHCMYTIAAQNFVAGNASVGAQINWKELY